MTSRETRVPRASQRVLEYLRENPNIQIPYPEIARHLGVGNEYSVSNAIGYLIEKGVNIERPMRGMVIYHPTETGPVKPESKLYEYVGTSHGIVIVRGEDNELYRIEALFGGDSNG